MKTTIDMAREAGWKDLRDYDSEMRHDFFMGNTDSLKAFEALVRADEREQGQKWFDAVTAQHKQEILAEREACAKVADYYASGMDRNYSEIIADDIRNRGST
jgi:uncharacterized protein (UPF0128 family)